MKNIKNEKDTEENKLDNVEQQEKIQKEQVKSENKILKGFFIAIISFSILFVIFAFIINSFSNFNYNGLKFNVVKEEKITFYRIAFPFFSSITGKYAGDYNIYIRNDPRELEEEIPFNGELVVLKNMVINSAEDFNCDGDGIIAIANFLKLEILGIEIIKDENATCDESGRYSYINIIPGNISGIEQVGPACYNFNINNCEIIKVTERYMIENFIKVNEKLKRD